MYFEENIILGTLTNETGKCYCTVDFLFIGLKTHYFL